MRSSSGKDALEQPGTRVALLQLAVEAEHAARRGAHEHDVQQNQQPAVHHCRATGGEGYREVDVGVVKSAEERRDPHQASRDERDGNRHLAEGHQIAEEMSMRDNEACDERAMPRKIIFRRSVQQFFGQSLAISAQKAASGDLWPAYHKELHAHEDADESQIAKPGLLMKSIHDGFPWAARRVSSPMAISSA